VLVGIFTAPRKIELVEMPEPVLPPAPRDGGTTQMIFQPECTCLCGSDLPFFTGSDEWPIKLSHSLHEMTGTVIDTNGTRFQPGERVLCVPVNQEGLSERFLVDDSRAIRLDTRVSEEEAMLAQPLGTVIYALKKLPNLIDLDVAVIGQGPIGQLYNMCLRNLGARHIIGIDLLESRLAASRDFGATETICNATADPVAALKEILNGELPDIVIEAVGHADQQFDLAIDICRPYGKILFFGVPPERVEVKWRDTLIKNLTVYCSMNPDFERDFPLAMRWIGEGRVNVKPLITHRFPLAQIQEAFDVFCDRKEGALKVVVEFPSWQKQ
jgi:threonine dehydrogenase-like Zn-dependent dehydrogenase